MAPISRASPRAIRERTSSSRTSAAAATTPTRSPPCATVRTSIPICPAAASIAACSTPPSRRSARSACSGDPTSRCAPGLAKLRALDVIGLAPRRHRERFAGRTRRASFRAGASPRAPTPPASPAFPPRAPRAMIDVNTLIGPYPFRARAASGSGACSCACSTAKGLDGAWVGHLPSAFYRDPTPGNDELFAALASVRAIACVPCPRFAPTGRKWEQRARSRRESRGARRCARIRRSGGSGPHDAVACASSRSPRASGAWRCCSPFASRICASATRWTVPAIVTAAAVRALARAGDAVRLVVTAAGREMIEEVHWGLTAAEQQRVFWDISWIWGPPEDHLAKLFRTIGAERFVFGTQWPLRLTQTPRANLDLLAGRRATAGACDAERLCARTR